MGPGCVGDVGLSRRGVGGGRAADVQLQGSAAGVARPTRPLTSAATGGWHAGTAAAARATSIGTWVSVTSGTLNVGSGNYRQLQRGQSETTAAPTWAAETSATPTAGNGNTGSGNMWRRKLPATATSASGTPAHHAGNQGCGNMATQRGLRKPRATTTSASGNTGNAQHRAAETPATATTSVAGTPAVNDCRLRTYRQQ